MYQRRNGPFRELLTRSLGHDRAAAYFRSPMSFRSALRAAIRSMESARNSNGNVVSVPSFYWIRLHPLSLRAIRDISRFVTQLEQELKQSADRWRYNSVGVIRVLVSGDAAVGLGDAQASAIWANAQQTQLSLRIAQVSALVRARSAKGLDVWTLIAVDSGRKLTYPLGRFVAEGSIRVGRHRDNDVVLANRSVSRYHTLLTYDVARRCLWAEDLGSANGTMVNNLRIHRKLLQSGDILTLGTVQVECIKLVTSKLSSRTTNPGQ